MENQCSSEVIIRNISRYMTKHKTTSMKLITSRNLQRRNISKSVHYKREFSISSESDIQKQNLKYLVTINCLSNS